MSLPENLRRKLTETLELRRGVQLVWQASPRWFSANLVMTILQGIFPLLTLYMLKVMLDAVSAALTTSNRAAALEQVLQAIFWTGIVTLAGNLTRVIGSNINQFQAQVVSDYMMDIIHTQSIRVDLAFYEHAGQQDTLHRAQQEATYRPTMIVNGLGQVLQNLIALLGTGLLVIAFNPWIGLILLVAVVPGILARIFFTRRLFDLQRQYTPEDRRSRYFSWLLTSPDHAKEVRLLELGGLLMQRYREIRLLLRSIRWKIQFQRSVIEFLTQILATVAVFAAYAFVAYQTILGTLTLGTLVLYYQAFQRGQTFLNDFLASLAGLYENNLFIRNLYEFLDLQPKIVAPAQPAPMPHPLQKGLTFENVRFSYPNSARIALRDISFSLKPGEVIAVVGENGSGKTTLVKLLCRLYDPAAGRITLDGVDLRQFDPRALREQFSVVFQDYARYNLTAQENIGLGDHRRAHDLNAITAAAQLAGADAVIQTLPRKYQSVLGKLFENGEELSIGQWQKIALARAFLRNSQLIILDEPTSALDPRAEYEVFQTFRELLNGRSAILISHRLSTVKMADRIYVFQEGQIVESGTHAELVAQAGKYADLYETQAQYYR